MNQQNSLPLDLTLARLIATARGKIALCCPGLGDRWLFVDVHGQRLALVKDKHILHLWPISTAEAGLSNADGSNGTPPGLHRILQGIGEDAPVGTIFDSRQPTGEIWDPDRRDNQSDDLILTRILTLDGQEEGINRGPGIDSRERYIYIHGTNHENLIGTPVSHGCVRMTNTDIIQLFDSVEEGDPVVIV
jgi:lipoprotein-anchoring transpeptidase ErfK/SrfK